MRKMKRWCAISFAMGLLISSRQTTATAYPYYFSPTNTGWEADVAKAGVIAVLTIGPNICTGNPAPVTDFFWRPAPGEYLAHVDQLIKSRRMRGKQPLRERSLLLLQGNSFSSTFRGGSFRPTGPLQIGQSLVFLKRVQGEWKTIRQAPIRNGIVVLDRSLVKGMSIERQVGVIEQLLDWKDLAKFAPPLLLLPQP